LRSRCNRTIVDSSFCDGIRPSHVSGGVRQVSQLPHAPEASLYLLQIAPGKSLARHTHTGTELTQVLCGAFDDGRATFGPGDFDAADGEVHHQPVVAPGEVCVCLASVDGRLAFDGRIVGWIGRMIGM
jgi:putative transcriptional regulator